MRVERFDITEVIFDYPRAKFLLRTCATELAPFLEAFSMGDRQVGLLYRLKFRSSLAAIQLGVGWVRRAHLNPSRIASPDERVVTQHNGQLDHRCWVTTRIAYRVVDSFWCPCASNPTYSLLTNRGPLT